MHVVLLWQALRFYALVIVGCSSVGTGAYLNTLVVPKLVTAVLNNDKAGAGTILGLGLPVFTFLSVAQSIGLYYGELLALDWRRALTRRVRRTRVALYSSAQLCVALCGQRLHVRERVPLLFCVHA